MFTVGGVLQTAVSWVLVLSITGTSCVPALWQLPEATAAYLGVLRQLGMLESDPSSPVGVRNVAPQGKEGILPTIGEDGEPVGVLLNSEVFDSVEVGSEPAALANPISVSRVQSAYAQSDTLSGMLTITFTVSNNQPPGLVPSLPVSATITETIEVVSTSDFLNDARVVRNVLLTDDLLPANVSLVSASPLPDRSEDSIAWNLGHIPPLGSVTATLTLEIVPDTVPGFLELDTGATAWGTLEGRAVFASAAPARLAPDGFGDWLQWTVDADYYDEYMVVKAAELGNDWQAMFAYVSNLGYESYKGSLRGTRGTLWSEAGNSLDQASLLIAMLRGSGIPARYRHGTLSTGRAQELILSMFTEPQGTIGHIPRGTEVADPANDPQLLEETVDHWWVQAFLPGLGWTNLDPCLASARETGNRQAEGEQLRQLGHAVYSLGQVDPAMAHYAHALAIAREIGDRGNEGRCLGELGLIYRDLSQAERAVEYLEQAVAITREGGNRIAEGQCVGSLGAACFDLGQVEPAIEYFEQALAIARETGDRQHEAVWLANLGAAYLALDQPERAIACLEPALVIAREMGDRAGEARRLGSLGAAHAAAGRAEQAHQHYDQALAIVREMGDRRGEVGWLRKLGNACCRMGEQERALESYQQALAIAREIGDRREEALCCWQMGGLFEKSDPARAAELMQVRVDYERETGHADAEVHAKQVRDVLDRASSE